MACSRQPNAQVSSCRGQFVENFDTRQIIWQQLALAAKFGWRNDFFVVNLIQELGQAFGVVEDRQLDCLTGYNTDSVISLSACLAPEREPLYGVTLREAREKLRINDLTGFLHTVLPTSISVQNLKNLSTLCKLEF